MNAESPFYSFCAKPSPGRKWGSVSSLLPGGIPSAPSPLKGGLQAQASSIPTVMKAARTKTAPVFMCL